MIALPEQLDDGSHPAAASGHSMVEDGVKSEQTHGSRQ